MRWAIAVVVLALISPARGAETVPTTLPSGLGANVHFTDPAGADFKPLADAGFKFVRVELDRAKTETKSGEYDFAAYDRLLEALTSQGIRPVFVIADANAATKAVNHFAGRGIVWEIGGTQASILEACKAIHDAAPAEMLIGPACKGASDPALLEGCLKAGLLDYLSAVTVQVHRSTNPEAAADDYRKVRLLIARYGPKDKKIPILATACDGASKAPGISAERQGALFARKILTNLASGVNASIGGDWHGQVDVTNPAYLSAKALSSQLDGFTFNKRLLLEHGGDDDYVLLFDKGDEIRLVAWTAAREPHTLVIPALPGSFAMTSQSGEALAPVDAREGGLPVFLESAPKYITPLKHNELLTALANWERLPQELFVQAPGEARVLASTTGPSDPMVETRFGGQTIYGLAATTVGRPVGRGQEMLPHDVRLEIPGMPSVSQRMLIVVTNPLRAIILPPQAAGIPVRVENPGGDSFFGTVRLAGRAGVNAILRLESDQTETVVWLPGAPGTFGGDVFRGAVEILDNSGKLVLRTPVIRYTRLAFAADHYSVHAEGDDKIHSTQSLSLADNQGPAPGLDALSLEYEVDAGEKSLCLKPDAAASKVEGKPKSLGLWVRGDRSGNVIGLRFTDQTMQTFQSDGEKLDFGEWRYISMPLDGQSGSHWGGAADGIVHNPIRLDTLLLLENAEHAKTAGNIHLSSPMLLYEEEPKP